MGLVIVVIVVAVIVAAGVGRIECELEKFGMVLRLPAPVTLGRVVVALLVVAVVMR